MDKVPITIVGGGVVGLAVANELASNGIEEYIVLSGILKNHFDFVIQRDEKHPNYVQMLGMESPALAVAKYVRELIEEQR